MPVAGIPKVSGSALKRLIPEGEGIHWRTVEEAGTGTGAYIPYGNMETPRREAPGTGGGIAA